MTEDTYVGKFLNGKKIVDVSSDSKFVNFYFEDGSYDTAPIIDGVVKIEFDTVSQEANYVDMDGNKIDVPDLPRAGDDEEETELGFYKTLQPIPFTDEDGNELGKTEVGSIQEVPVALGDYWVAEGWAKKTEKPEESVLSKITGGLLGNK